MNCDFDTGQLKQQHFQSTLLGVGEKKESTMYDFDNVDRNYGQTYLVDDLCHICGRWLNRTGDVVKIGIHMYTGKLVRMCSNKTFISK